MMLTIIIRMNVVRVEVIRVIVAVDVDIQVMIVDVVHIVINIPVYVATETILTMSVRYVVHKSELVIIRNYLSTTKAIYTR
ncbi:hypothetical protein [Pseudoneobacillus sp. C159]